jgi:NTE family protein
MATPKGARRYQARLEPFWEQVSNAALLSPFRRSPLDILPGRWTLDTSPVFLAFDLMARVFSPSLGLTTSKHV